MFKKVIMQVVAIVCVVALGSLQTAFAQTTGAVGSIVSVSGGWSADTFSITVTNAVVNPAGCAYSDGYVMSISDGGYNTMYAAVLTAFSTGSQVVVTVSNTVCTAGRPTIIGVTVYNS
ncbi:hypothetical protein ACFFJT_00400 [Dyella flava]|uniref:Uncharacterized protein n=1 Tax=Dyella flava TaxID=1920170 RepID=A0ABS2JYX7_9GAMM|nr:hypothetical protein [Dyella flava]MBM7124221.1 hypothetical protein [Dyella flava]GLQ50502.1 hypothetical protein GCM10010872_19510 [Dyella flava]